MGEAGTSASSWDFGDTRDDLIHRIHPYPARFPAFITTKALEYADGEGVEVRNVADVFCGCGTTAVEAKRNGKDFWGCDINPLATLIARVKTHRYSDVECWDGRIRRDEGRKSAAAEVTVRGPLLVSATRIRYWFGEENIDDLIRLDRTIRMR